MRHRIHFRKLNRTSEHRKAMLRNMAQSLIEHGQITTTLAKAKTLRPIFEQLITTAVKARKMSAASDKSGSLRMRRKIHQVLNDRSMIPAEHQLDYSAMSNAQRQRTLRMASGRRYRTGEPKGRLVFTGESVARRLIETIAPQYESREGGYTRIIRLSKHRIGDATQLAIIQLVGREEAPTSLTKPSMTARRRRTNSRYAAAIKAAKSWGKASPTKSAPASVPADAPAEDGASEDT